MGFQITHESFGRESSFPPSSLGFFSYKLFANTMKQNQAALGNWLDMGFLAHQIQIQVIPIVAT